MSDKPTARLFSLSDLVTALTADTRDAAAALKAGRPRGPQTGLRALDKELGDYLAPGLHILQGSPGSGKTALSLQISSDCQFPALFVTAEMSRLELFRRLVSRQTGTFLGRLKTGELGEAEAERLALVTAKNLSKLSILDATVGQALPETIVASAETARGDSAHLLIVIDSLQAWARSQAPHLPEYDALGEGLRKASNLAAELSAPVIVVSHRNRAGNTAKNGDGLHAAKGNGAIEYSAESILDLTRDDEKPDVRGEVGVTAKLAKNRNGVSGISISLRFCGRVQSFESGN